MKVLRIGSTREREKGRTQIVPSAVAPLRRVHSMQAAPTSPHTPLRSTPLGSPLLRSAGTVHRLSVHTGTGPRAPGKQNPAARTSHAQLPSRPRPASNPYAARRSASRASTPNVTRQKGATVDTCAAAEARDRGVPELHMRAQALPFTQVQANKTPPDTLAARPAPAPARARRASARRGWWGPG